MMNFFHSSSFLLFFRRSNWEFGHRFSEVSYASCSGADVDFLTAWLDEEKRTEPLISRPNGSVRGLHFMVRI